MGQRARRGTRATRAASARETTSPAPTPGRSLLSLSRSLALIAATGGPSHCALVAQVEPQGWWWVNKRSALLRCASPPQRPRVRWSAPSERSFARRAFIGGRFSHSSLPRVSGAATLGGAERPPPLSPARRSRRCPTLMELTFRTRRYRHVRRAALPPGSTHPAPFRAMHRLSRGRSETALARRILASFRAVRGLSRGGC